MLLLINIKIFIVKFLKLIFWQILINNCSSLSRECNDGGGVRQINRTHTQNPFLLTNAKFNIIFLVYDLALFFCWFSKVFRKSTENFTDY